MLALYPVKHGLSIVYIFHWYCFTKDRVGHGEKHSTHWNATKCSQTINICLELIIFPSDPVFLRTTYDHLWAEYSHAFHTAIMVGRAWVGKSHCSLIRTTSFSTWSCWRTNVKTSCPSNDAWKLLIFAELQKSAGKQDVLLRRIGVKHNVVLLIENLISKWTK